MIPSIGAAFYQSRALPAAGQATQPPVDTGPRDAAIRLAFAAFDTPVRSVPDQGTQPVAQRGVPRLPQLAAQPAEDARDRGVQVYAIDDYLKCIFGMAHDAAMIGPRVAQYIDALDSNDCSAPHALSVSRLTALAAFYIGLCQACAFKADGEFDTQGLTSFVAARLALPEEVVAGALTWATSATYVFMSMRQSHNAPQLSIYDAHGQDLVVPSPSLRFDGLHSGAICIGYLRNITLSMQTLRAVDFRGTDLTGAHIAHCIFEGVSFNNAHLSDVVFRKTVATQCAFNDAHLARATFHDSRLNDTVFLKCTMPALGLHATELQSTRFDTCDLQDMVFDNESQFEVGTRLSVDRTEFGTCDMTRARLRHVQWSEGGFTDCRLWDATVSDSGFARARWHHEVSVLVRPPLAGASFSATQFRACELKHMNASESHWMQCLFEKGKLSGVSWRHSVLHGMRYVSVGMAGVRFDNSECVDLRIEAMCDLDRVSFADTKLTKVRFDAAQTKTMLRLNSIDFSNAELNDVQFTKCQMVAAKFPAAQLRSVHFSRCNLNHSDFRGSHGADLLRMLMANRMKRYSAEGMIPVGAAIGSLNSRTRRDTLLNHVASRDCLLANVMAGSSGLMTASLVLHIADRLLHEANDPVDSDVWMITALTQSYKKIRSCTADRARIDAHLFRMLQRHLPELNDLGLWRRPEQRWGLEAVEHLCRLLHSQRADPVALRRNSPLIAAMSVGACIGALTLDRPTRAMLEESRRGVVPVELQRAFGEWALPHAALLTAEGDRAVILLPETSAALLGVRPDPVVVDRAYRAFSVVDGNWQACEDVSTEVVFAPFPLIAPALHPRSEMLARFIESLAVPANLKDIFTNGLIHYHRRSLCATKDQYRIDDVFRPLITSMRDAPSGCDLAPWVAAHLLPLEIHQSRVYDALAHLYVPGDASANGMLALGLASLLFRAASTEIFGLEDNAPQFLTYYAFAWLNQAIFSHPAILESLGGTRVHLEIAERTVGARNAVSHMGVIGARLTEVFGHPLLAEHPHARRVRVNLCR